MGWAGFFAHPKRIVTSVRQIPRIKFFHSCSVIAELVDGCTRWRECESIKGFGKHSL
jgi:hypothetical protein